MKKFISGLLIGAVLATCSTAFAATFVAQQVSYPVLVNGKKLNTDKPIVSINGSTYMPLKVIGEALNVKVAWNSSLKRIEIGETTKASTMDEYVASVGNQKISTQEYRVFSKMSMNQFLSSIPNNTTTIDKYDWSQKVKGETVKEQVKKETLSQIQENKIILIKAKEAGIQLTAEELKNIDNLDQSIAQNISQTATKADAEKAIQDAFGISLSDYKEVYKNFSLTQKYIDAEHNKVTVADDEVKKFYDDNKANYDKVTVTHILISTVDSNGKPVTASKKNEAKKKAEDLLARVKAGKDIKALAVENSDDKPAVTSNKGQYTFSKGEMTTEFENWAFSSHAVGDVAIVETSYGYHVIEFENRVQSTYDEVKGFIKSSLFTSKFTGDFTKKMEGWKKEKQFELVKNDSILNKTDNSIYGV